jgi:MFS family permease
MYVLTIFFLVLFYKIEQNHDEPIVDFKFFKSIVFVGTLINNFIVFMALIGAIFLIPVFVATFMGYNATQTGYLFLPMAFFMVIASLLGSKLTGKVRSYIVITASTIVAGIGLLTFTILDPRSGPLDIIIPMSIMAFGLGFAMSQRTNAIASVVPAHEMGMASSVLALARNIAGAFGIALFGTLLSNSLGSAVLNTARNSAVHATSALQFQQGATLIILHSYIVSYHTVFYVAAFVLFFGAILAFFIKPKVEITDVQVHVE